MRTFSVAWALLLAACVAGGCAASGGPDAEGKADTKVNAQNKVVKSDGEWKKILTPEQYRIMRQKGTERPFSGKYVKFDETGVYTCAACGQELFVSDTKFNAHCGWPSFYKPAASNSIIEHADNSLGMRRTEVVCSRCGAHLGHVFDDGPKPTGLRYCINSVSLDFEQKADENTPEKTPGEK